ncbi:Internal alternative NAD(P)H-ubiquinone oxidoreductase A1 [Lathyrus oleraceus]|uniref:Internal alternative NAD(P)H-ubiquinone oxidoreductase A1 n=1 Tax=Pisum sativum TaxID=3888 RepID=A0A9D5ACQ4_PEA|nr:Internal alternative NAD(P)H-ubiquinone oxidoreductase A1 [Pisum sativum]
MVSYFSISFFQAFAQDVKEAEITEQDSLLRVFLDVETFDAINLQETVVPNKKSKVLEKLEKRVEADIRITPVAAQMIWIEKDMKIFKGKKEAARSKTPSTNQSAYCETVTNGGLSREPYQFKVAYDKLVIAYGAESSTFGIKGVKEHAFFLCEVNHAQEIRKRLLLNLMLSENPGISEEEKKGLLHCVVIGGGPTRVEFSGELSDFITKDVRERYTHVKDYIHVTLIEANEILSSFDVSLRQYAMKHLTKSGVRFV